MMEQVYFSQIKDIYKERKRGLGGHKYIKYTSANQKLYNVNPPPQRKVLKDTRLVMVSKNSFHKHITKINAY